MRNVTHNHTKNYMQQQYSDNSIRLHWLHTEIERSYKRWNRIKPKQDEHSLDWIISYF